MKYSNPVKQVHVWKHCIPLVIILILGFVLYRPNKTISNVPTLEDSIIINPVHFDSTLDRIDSEIVDSKYMYEINESKDLFAKIPFIHPWIKNWTFEHYFNQYRLTYHKNNITLSITFGKGEDLVRYEKGLQVSMIEEIPVTITYYDDYYQAYFTNQDYFYYVISYGIEKSSFVQLLKQMLGGIK